MNKNTSSHEGGEQDGDPLEPITSGRQFVADHFRFWQHNEGQTPTEHLPDVADLVILTDLSEPPEVDPELRASVHPYPPIRSEMLPLTLNAVVEQIRLMTGYPPEG